MAVRKTAAQIMRKKAAVKAELDKRLPNCSETSSQAQADALWEKSTEKLAGLMRLPGMRGLFIRIWAPMTRKIFGPDNGFKNRFYPKAKGEYRMDILACPYCRYFTELGCPELTRIFCENDERMYGNLPGLSFERKGTLGKGADHCDFCIRRV